MGVFNLKPPIRTFFPTWSVGKVVKMLRLWGPNRKLDLRTLTYKTLMLMALATARRVNSLVLFFTETRVFIKHIKLDQGAWIVWDPFCVVAWLCPSLATYYHWRPVNPCIWWCIMWGVLPFCFVNNSMKIKQWNLHSVSASGARKTDKCWSYFSPYSGGRIWGHFY